PVLAIGIDRPEKRNALNDGTIAALHEAFSRLPFDARAVLIHAIPRIAQADLHIGYVTESLMAAIAQGPKEAKSRVRAFLDKRAAKVERPD
ncbi:MAG: hypothetical protein KGM15_16085, partial [Pseudomonadota bacterium]|nr:hypothetical protein [Pseudomonadota bacterium]